MSTAATRNSDAPGSQKRSGDINNSWRDKPDQATSTKSAGRGRGRTGGAGRPRAGRGSGKNATRGGAEIQKPSGLPTERTDSLDKTLAGGNSQVNGKGQTRRIDQPNLSVDVSVPPSSGTPSPYSRRRRNTHRRSGSTASSKPHPINAVTVPPIPIQDSKGNKDLSDPPAGKDSSAPVHDLREDIRNLVDHVRSFAIENNRPSSPSTHIDWAGDDDDSLPDLEDWGISSKLTSDADTSIIGSEPKQDYLAPVEKEISTLPIVEEKREIPSQPSPSQNHLPEEVSAPQVDEPSQPRRERRRERGNKRDRERRGQVNTSQSNAPSSLTLVVPKKSLLERLSSPVRSDIPSTLPNPKVSRYTSSKSQPSVKSEINKEKSPFVTQEKKSNLHDSANVVDTETDAISEDTTSNTSSLETKVEPNDTNKHSFDWSDEPMDFETLPVFDPPKVVEAPKLDVKPVVPEVSTTPVSFTSNAPSAPARSSPRLRSQRPLSSDATGHSRNNRSSHRTHNPRNQSEPHVPASAGVRTRAPTTTRPKIRSEALAMLTRSLRESPSSTKTTTK